MSLSHSPQVVTNGLVFYYDMNNVQKSWKGQPTTNLVDETMSIYNNVPGDVSASLVTTSEKYKGANVYKLTLTPTTSTGVSYLTAGNNPGLGVISNGGGGLASRYTGHSIFFKPTVAMHSSPIFTHYSNITGWQSSSNYYSMGDGWYRAHVIWYDTVTRSDGKFWAINPLSATLNVPVATYFAGPFKEDRNDSAFVSQYVYSSRTNTQTVLDLTGNNTITANSLVYASDGTFSFNGSTTYITSSNAGLFHGTGNFTYSCWAKWSSLPGLGTLFENGLYTGGILIRFENNLIHIYSEYSATSYNGTMAFTPTLGVYYNLVLTRVGDMLYLYSNGAQISSVAFGSSINIQPTTNLLYIGMSQHAAGQCFDGRIDAASVYNRALSASEVKQNFNALRGRYGI